MTSRMLKWNTLFLFGFLVAVGIVWYTLKPILTPFFLGILLAYLGDPLVRRLMTFGMPRLLSLVTVFVLIFLLFVMLIVLLIPLIEKQTQALIAYLPKLINWLQNISIPWITTHFSIDTFIDTTALKTLLSTNFMKASSAATLVWTTALHSSQALLGWVASIILTPVVTFYLLRDWDRILINSREILPRSIEPTVIYLIQESNAVISAFFRGQLLVMASLGIFYSLALTLIGLQVGIIIGLIVGLATIVPYLGLIIGLISGCIAAYLQYGTWTAVALVILVFGVGQSLEGMFLTPKLVGHRIGLHPVAVIFSVLTGGYLFGFLGVLLALPSAAIMMVLLRYAYRHYRASNFYIG